VSWKKRFLRGFASAARAISLHYYPDEPYVVKGDADINMAKIKNHEFYVFIDCMVGRQVLKSYDEGINYILHHCLHAAILHSANLLPCRSAIVSSPA
jgi:hypothetical protein